MSLVIFEVCLSLLALRRASALYNDFSRRHLCQNPPALAGGRLRDKKSLIPLHFYRGIRLIIL